MRINRLALVLVLVSLILVVIAWDGTSSAQGQNLLTNPGFEGQYGSYVPETAQELADCPLNICTTAQVPSGWKPWWVKERPTDVNPEFKPATRDVSGNRVYSGDRASQYFSFWSTHKAGLRQTVTVPAYAVVEFSVWGHAWMTESDSSMVSDFAGTPNMRIGIDPTGGTNVYSPSIVWSGMKQVYDAYQPFSVRAQAQGDRVTVFTFSAPSVNPNSPEFGFKHTDIYWDEASLVVVGAGAAPAPSQPTAASGGGGATQPVQAAAAVSVAPTATPNADGVIYIEVQSGDSLWAIAARAGLTLDEILELNDMTRDSFVQPGDLLIIGYGDPPGEESQAESTPETSSEESAVTEEASEKTAIEAPVESTAEAEAASADVSQPEAAEVGASLEAGDATSAISIAEQSNSGASVCLTAFDDGNQNGILDSGETLRQAVAFTISDAEAVVSNYVTDGASEPFCIKGLNAGSYRITRSNLPNEVLTTPGDHSLSLTDGSSITLEFGSYENEEVDMIQESENNASQPDSESNGPGAGIIILAVAVVILIAVSVLVIRLRARGNAG